MTKHTVTLPLKFWDRLREIKEEAGGTLSDAVYAVLDVGFEAIDAEEVEEKESESESEDSEEDESEEVEE